MRRLWDFKRGFNKSFITGRGHNAEEGEDTSSEGAVDRQTSPPRTPTTTACPLTCSELPRRLFRFPPDPSCPIPPLLTYLFDSYSPSANSHKGYPLCRAVLAQNYPLIGCLLSYGADPSIKSCLVVEVAISLRDIKAVRMLIERGDGGKGASIDDEQGRRLSSERRRKKRRRISDRILITSRLVECAMRKGARDVVQYFMEEKGMCCSSHRHRTLLISMTIRYHAAPRLHHETQSRRDQSQQDDDEEYRFKRVVNLRQNPYHITSYALPADTSYIFIKAPCIFPCTRVYLRESPSRHVLPVYICMPCTTITDMIRLVKI